MGVPLEKGDGNGALPATHHAIVANERGKLLLWDQATCPPLQPDQVLYRTDAVAINPSDTKMTHGFQTPYCILGSDFAGTVLAVGSAVQHVSVGDRVCGAMHGMCKVHSERGAFTEYNVTIPPTWLKIPDSVDSPNAAALCTGLATAGLALRALGLPLPDTPADKPFPVLVYGGSTATGTMTIQLLRAANMIPIATCSPRSAAMVKSYGAEATFDYHDNDCSEIIRAYTSNKLRFALDCITTPESTERCFNAIGRAGGRYVSLDPYLEHAAKRKAVRADWVVGPAIFGHEITWPAPWTRPPAPELLEYGRRLFRVAQTLFDEGKLWSHPIKVVSGGLDTVLEGVEMVKSGAVSGQKLVVQLH